MDEEEQFNDIWADWMAEEGLAIEDEIQETLVSSRGLLDIDDGTHAQWIDGTLGVLLTFDLSEIHSILNAWDAAEDGNMVALATLMHWLQGFSGFLEACMTNIEEEN